MASKRQKMLFYLAGSFFLILFVYALLSMVTAPQQISREDAVRFSLEDASKHYFGNEDIYVKSVAYDERTRQWGVVIEVIGNSHSACPAVDRLEYTLMPISSRPPKPVIDDCDSHPIFRREQALINSAKHQSVSELVTQGALGCAFKLPLNPSEVRSYCSFADTPGIESFAATYGIQDSYWVAQWTLDGESKFVALDTRGTVFAAS